MRILTKSLVLSIFATLFLGLITPVLAATPTLSATFSGGSNSNVQITVTNANSYGQINLYSRQSSSLWTTMTNIGQTDSGGYFTQVISLPSDGSSSPIQMYATVGGLQSPTISVYPGSSNGCTYNCGSPYGLSLSQNSVSLTVGQTVYVNAIYGGSGYNNNIFVSSNSNSSVATVSAVASQVSVYGVTSGTSTIVICSSNNISSCASLYVTVTGGSGNNGSVWFSPSAPSMYVGQSLAVSINSSAYNTYGGSNSAYYVSNNSNSSVVTANVSGTVLNLYANQSGSSTITICQSSLNFCGTIYVAVTGGNTYGNLSLSQTSLTLNVGQSSTVTANNSNSGYIYISSNSNSAVVSATVSGTSIYLNGLTNGSSTISVCSNNSQCASLYVTVSGTCYSSYCGGTGSLSLSQSSLNLTVGQSTTITAYNNGSGGIYVSSNSNSAVASYNVSGSSINVYGNSLGSTTMNICSNYNSACATLYVTVGGGNCGYYGCGSNLSLSQSSVTLNVGQSSSVTISGSGYYTISSNSTPTVVSAAISGSTLNLYGQNPGSTTLSICQNNSSYGCATLYVTVSGYNYGNGNGYYGNGLSLNQTSLNLAVGQTANVNATYSGGGYGNIFVSSNSNSSVASVSAVASQVAVYGINPGSSTIVICSSNNTSACANLYVTVGGNNYGYGGGLQYPGNSGSVLGANTYANGQLISENGTVYIIYQNSKSAFSSASVFKALGFSFSNVLQTGVTGLANSGYVISSPYASHPWGSWIKDGGNTVYFVHQSGLIPVPNWSTFINNGGQAVWIVGSNTADFRLPVLSPMVNNEPRLR